MVVDRFPMFRLATLIARQFSSPIAARIKRYAVSHPRFGAAVCIRLATLFHVCEWRARALSLRLAGAPLPKNTRPPPLPAGTAINLGGDLLGEIIMFSLGALIIIFEVNRQAGNKEIKELDERSQWLAILLSLEELEKEIVLQQEDIERLHGALLEMQAQDQDPTSTSYDKDNGLTPDSYSYSKLTCFEPIHTKFFS